MQGFYSDDSMIRKVHSEPIMAIHGLRALIIQATHPLAFAGVIQHSKGFADPASRLARTAAAVDLVIWGKQENAEKMCRYVRQAHSQVYGSLEQEQGAWPKGSKYKATDQDLLLWVLYGLVDSAIQIYSDLIRTLSDYEKEALWNDYKIFGSLFGIQDEWLDFTWVEMKLWYQELYDQNLLSVSPKAKQTVEDIVLHFPFPIWMLPLVEAIRTYTLHSLDKQTLKMYGWDNSGLLHALQDKSLPVFRLGYGNIPKVIRRPMTDKILRPSSAVAYRDMWKSWD